jgi:hypothetical protein
MAMHPAPSFLRIMPNEKSSHRKFFRFPFADIQKKVCIFAGVICPRGGTQRMNHIINLNRKN